MKNWTIRLFLMVFALSAPGVLPTGFAAKTLTIAEAAEKGSYYCPMHPDFKSDKPGSCPICGMNLVKKPEPQKQQAAAPKGAGAPPAQKEAQGRARARIKFYRNPMNPEITSPVPKKDEMGMDYIPVYEGEEKGVRVSPERQQMIGVTTARVEKRPLSSVISAVGRVAYDPGLFVAQQEYLQAVKTAQALGESSLTAVKEQASSLAAAAKQKLLLLGMNEQGIEELARKGAPQESLYLPGSGDTAWVYISVYEYEIGMMREGIPVEVIANAYPGRVFKGKVSSLAPVLNKETRSLQVRAVVEDREHVLRPEMFVNATIKRDLGEKLLVPDSAVIDTGVRKVVYVKKDNDRFEQRQIKTGVQSEGYYEVLEGLSEGESVVTNGTFLIDSESRMRSS